MNLRATRIRAAVRAVDRPLALLASMAFVVQIGVAVMLPLLPLYATQFGATPFMLGLLTSAHAVTSAVGQLAGGFLTERLASRRLVAFGIGLYAGANLLIATATAALPLILYRGLAGLGGGINQVSERIYLTEVTDRARRAFSNGILSAAGAAGSVLGPAIGGLLVVVGDLRVPFLLVAATSALATVAALYLPRPAAGAEPAIAASAAEPLATDPLGDPVGVAAAPTAIEGEPEPDHGRRPLLALFFAQLALNAGFGAFITTYAIFATGTLGWTTVDVGVVFSMFGLGSVVLGPWLARQADRTGRRRMAILGCIPVVCFGLVFAAGAPHVLVYVAAIAGGGGLTGFEASWFALLAAETDEGRRGRIFGIITALTNLGIVVGALGAARIWEQIDIHAAVVVAAVTFALAGLAMFAYPRDRIAPPAPTAAAVA
ncbi:MAG: MFS transporter [Candidatus Limnocylindrales bacterium]